MGLEFSSLKPQQPREQEKLIWKAKCGVGRFEGAAPATSSVAMASSSPPSLASKVHELDVACAELKSLHDTRAVYEKRGALFFRTTVKAAAKSQQQELEILKARAKKASS